MICKNCGREAQEGSKFCESCGATLEIETPEVTPEATPEVVTETVSEVTPEVAPEATKKSKLDVKKIIPIAVIAVVVIALLLLVKSCFSEKYDSQLKDIVKVVNKQQTDVDKIVEAAAPGFVADAYSDIRKILEDSDEYGKDVKDLFDQTPDVLEDAYGELFDVLEDQYGDKVKISYKVKDKEKLSKDERKSITTLYSSFAELAPGLTEVVEGLEGCTDLTDKEIKKLVKVVDNLEKDLKKFKVSAGYVLDVELTIEGKDDDESENIDVVVVKANGDWMIDYVSTVALANDVDLDELGEFVEDEIDFDDLNDALSEVAGYMEDMDMDILGMALNMVEDLDDVTDAITGGGDIDDILEDSVSSGSAIGW
ncbi:MAG: zinc ribbon domain-containing protein [Lachnospiraceae bacterium]|nr:zinc ribbon domain-containing protein [Lachnospiraceae bacterium]